jgi:hypothetical protein
VTSDGLASVGTKKARGIPGRVFVFCFVPLLIVLGVLTFGIGYRFQVIMNRLEESRSLWPSASLELKERYNRLNQNLQDSESEPAKITELAKFRANFDQASQFDTQSIAALKMELAVPSLAEQLSWQREDFKKPGIKKLLESERQRAIVQNDTLGWLTVRGLRLKLPPIFAPSSMLSPY